MQCRNQTLPYCGQQEGGGQHGLAGAGQQAGAGQHAGGGQHTGLHGLGHGLQQSPPLQQLQLVIIKAVAANTANELNDAIFFFITPLLWVVCFFKSLATSVNLLHRITEAVLWYLAVHRPLIKKDLSP